MSDDQIANQLKVVKQIKARPPRFFFYARAYIALARAVETSVLVMSPSSVVVKYPFAFVP